MHNVDTLCLHGPRSFRANRGAENHKHHEIRGRKTQSSWPTVGTPRDLAFSNLNQIARRERRWIPPVKTHAYMCSARDLEYARVRNLRYYGPNRGLLKQMFWPPWAIKTNTPGGYHGGTASVYGTAFLCVCTRRTQATSFGAPKHCRRHAPRRSSRKRLEAQKQPRSSANSQISIAYLQKRRVLFGAMKSCRRHAPRRSSSTSSPRCCPPPAPRAAGRCSCRATCRWRSGHT
jgi:hypothetical protein